MAYAQVKSGQCDLKDLPPKALTKGQRDDAWDEQMREWRHDLNNTAAQMASGEAFVDPKKSSTCHYCEHKLLCRINDRREQLVAENVPSSNGFVASDGFSDE